MFKFSIRTGLIALSTILLANATPERPNIILVMADDLGWGDVSYTNESLIAAQEAAQGATLNEWCQTPNLDAMASNSLRFDRFYAAAAVCSPTRASCLTGRNPLRVGIPWANRGFLQHDDGGANTETPLSSVLANAGYRTGHFGKWHLGVLTTLTNDGNRGGAGNADLYSAPWHFNYDACFANESSIPTYHAYRNTNNSLSLPTSFSDPNFYGTRFWKMPTVWNYNSGEGIAAPVTEVNNPTNGDSSKLIVDKAVDFMQDAVSSNEPFFVVIWFATPHTPIIHADQDSPTTPAGSTARERAIKLNIEDMDTAMGDLNTALENMGVKNDTMLWFTSDNGPETVGASADWFDETSTGRSMRSGRFRARKRSLYEGGIRVPGILQWPAKISAGRTTDHIAVTSDYYTTILDYLELAQPNQKPLDGVSLRPVIENTATTREQPVGFYARGMRAWMKQPYKIVATGAGGDDTMIVPTTNSTRWELYDIDAPTSNSDVEDTSHSSYLGKASLDEVNDPANTLPQATKDIFIEMITEYQAWEATLGNDTPYVHSSQPTVVLSTPSNTVTAPFTVTATFSESVTELAANEFAVTNGTASALVGSGTTWSVTITPNVGGLVSVSLPQGAVVDADGSVNGQSNLLDVNYSNPVAPDVALTTPLSSVSAAFDVTATFNEEVSGLNASEFDVTNGTAANLTGGPTVYTVTVTPVADGDVTIQLPGGAAEDVDTNGNNASNSLVVTYATPTGEPGNNPGSTEDSDFVTFTGQTVDINELSPANGGNNIEKFTAGTVNDGVACPYTTLLYVRSGSGDGDARKVRAFVKFDLSSLEGSPANSATLTFNAHSLNNQNGVNVQLIPLNADWAATGTPAPTFNHATIGTAIDGGNISSGLAAADHTKDYSFDVTEIVNNWLDGTWTNHGVQIQLTSTGTANGIGIKTSGEGALALNVVSVPLQTLDFARMENGDDNVIEWNSSPGATYRIETSVDLQEPWDVVATIAGVDGAGATKYTHVGGGVGSDKRFYRIVFVSN